MGSANEALFGSGSGAAVTRLSQASISSEQKPPTAARCPRPPTPQAARNP
jgi:hypothetical protein